MTTDRPGLAPARPPGARWAVVIAVVGLLAVACSATPDSELSAQGSGDPTDIPDLGSGGEGTATTTGSGGTLPSGAPDPAGGSGSPSGTGSPGPTVPGVASPSTPSTTTPTGPVDDGPIVVGVYYTGIEGADDVGVTGLALGDTPGQIHDIAGWVNANGGMGGRPVEVVLAKSTLGSSEPLEAQDQTACSTFLEDHDVDLAIVTVNTTQIIVQCLSAAGVVQANDSSKPQTAAAFARHAELLYSSMPTQERAATGFADELARNGYLSTPGARLGIVRHADPAFQVGADAFVRRLADHGVAPVVDVTVCDVTACGAGPSSSQTQSAILQLRSNDVDHLVLISDGTIVTPFLLAAASQGYYPRLGIYSLNAPQVVALNQSQETMRDAIGMGWTPSFDTEKAQEGERTANAGLCHEIVRAGGHPSPGRLGDTSVEFLCDGFFFLKLAVDGAGGSTDPPAIRSVVESFRSAFVPALTMATRFAPGRHDGASAYRTLVYVASCRCFHYDGPVREFP